MRYLPLLLYDIFNVILMRQSIIFHSVCKLIPHHKNHETNTDHQLRRLGIINSKNVKQLIVTKCNTRKADKDN